MDSFSAIHLSISLSPSLLRRSVEERLVRPLGRAPPALCAAMLRQQFFSRETGCCYRAQLVTACSSFCCPFLSWDGSGSCQAILMGIVCIPPSLSSAVGVAASLSLSFEGPDSCASRSQFGPPRRALPSFSSRFLLRKSSFLRTSSSLISAALLLTFPRRLHLSTSPVGGCYPPAGLMPACRRMLPFDRLERPIFVGGLDC